jgi:hypothetical protein
LLLLTAVPLAAAALPPEALVAAPLLTFVAVAAAFVFAVGVLAGTLALPVLAFAL